MANIYQELGNRISGLRHAQRWTQEQLAEQAGIGASYVARIEAGHRKPTLETLDRLARALGLSMSQLFALKRTGSKKRRK